MSNLRLDFYEAINKANTYTPKPKEKRAVRREMASIEDQIATLINESDSAVVVEEIQIDNDAVVEWVHNIYRKDEATIRRERELMEAERKTEEAREQARKEWRLRNKLLEKVARAGATTPSTSSSAAGAGGSGNRQTVSLYVETGYVDPGYVE